MKSPTPPTPGNKKPLKTGLITGCELRPCKQCRHRVFVPIESDWTVCTPCRKGWK